MATNGAELCCRQFPGQERAAMKRPSSIPIAILIVLSLSSLAAAQAYSVGVVGTTASPHAVDNNGNVAGVFKASRQAHAFLWSKSGGKQDLGTLGGDHSVAYGINSSGEIVGQANSSAGAPDQAFLWTRGAGMIDLGNLGGASSVANAINASGQVAGQSDLADGFTHAFYWSQSAGLLDLGTLQGGQQSGGNAINSAGEIAGWANVGTTEHAITWSQSGGLVDLGITPSCGATAFGINDSGVVVGWYNNSTGCSFTAHGFSWTKAGRLKDLGVLAGGAYSFAYGINSPGQIVGTGQSAALAPVALLWTADGTVHDLNTLIPSNTPRILVAANAINDAGQIVVDATAKNGTGQYALILTPIMSTALASSQNPSTHGQAVTFTATVSSIAGPPPDGDQVIFKAGTALLGNGILSKGVASVTTSSLGVGTHKITATYAGDSIYAASKAAALNQVVTK
jgi:probable HAF family extracellular repeat protein